jgi:pimeloyl-ACP methyl ester carboxylesterase
VRLRDFSAAHDGIASLICAPYALHGSTIADFAAGHSLVAALRDAGLKRIFATDWRSAGPDMRFFSIDTYLADLNVLVDELGGKVDLIGLCQGGWLALIYAARFPAKVRKLVLAGPAGAQAQHGNLMPSLFGRCCLELLLRRRPLRIFCVRKPQPLHVEEGSLDIPDSSPISAPPTFVSPLATIFRIRFI